MLILNFWKYFQRVEFETAVAKFFSEYLITSGAVYVFKIVHSVHPHWLRKQNVGIRPAFHMDESERKKNFIDVSFNL